MKNAHFTLYSLIAFRQEQSTFLHTDFVDHRADSAISTVHATPLRLCKVHVFVTLSPSQYILLRDAVLARHMLWPDVHLSVCLSLSVRHADRHSLYSILW